MLAPMAGITDQPFRQLCCQMGAGLAVSEMVSANPKVWKTEKSKRRLIHGTEAGICSVQIAGSDPQELAFAAQVNVDNGAQIIDINMGCPAKKVNKKLAGSALLKEPTLVEQIIQSVVNKVAVPVTLKIRTGWCENTRNGIEIAKIAEHNGIQSLVVHGRTRNDFYKGDAEYDTIKAIKQAVSIPVVANGDITNAITNKQDLTLAQDAIVKLGANSALTITSSSNKLDTVIDGVTIDLTQAQSLGDQPIHISITQDQESSKENIQSFVDKFNSLTNGITSNQYLKRDNMAAGLARSLRNDFQGTFEGKTLFSVGIEFDRSGNLKIDNKKLEEAMATNPEQLTSMLTGENGLLSKLETRVEPFTKSYGLMTDKKQSLQASLNIVNRQQKDHEVSMEQVYQRYLSQFTQMQQTIAQLESTMGQFGS